MADSISKRPRRSAVRSARLISPIATSPAVTAVMKANRKKNSKPELLVRKTLYNLGYRYRLHAGDLPGSPDIVLRKCRKVIFIHGWHQHQDPYCPLQSHPKSNTKYWTPKLMRNRMRDLANEQLIAIIGWHSLTIWECELRDQVSLRRRLVDFLG